MHFLFCVFIFDIWTVYHVLFIKDQIFLNRCNNTRITQIKHDWCKILSCVKYKLCFMSDINNHPFYIGAKQYDNSASKQMNFHLPWLKSQTVESSDLLLKMDLADVLGMHSNCVIKCVVSQLLTTIASFLMINAVICSLARTQNLFMSDAEMQNGS